MPKSWVILQRKTAKCLNKESTCKTCIKSLQKFEEEVKKNPFNVFIR